MQTLSRMTGRVTSRAVLAIAVLLTALLPAIDLAVGSVRHLFDPLASDAYYYFTVGRNIAQLGRVSFDSVLPTNGFHPVWQAIVAIAFVVGRIVSLADLHVVALLLGLQLAMLGGAVFLVGRAIERGEGRLTSLYATVPVGAYAIVMTPRWLREPGLAELIADVREAHRRHGGAGALYVYLRKQSPG